MLRFAFNGVLMVVLLTGCGDSSVGTGGAGGTGGTGGTAPIEPGPTCIDLCIKFTGECRAGFASEEECRLSCQASLDAEYDRAESCGRAAEDVFLCAAELECQDVYDWRDQNPPNAFPCRAEVLAYDELVLAGICFSGV